MANYELSQKSVEQQLKDDIQISPNSKDKLNYFRTAIKTAYPKYQKQFGLRALSFDSFAESVISWHNNGIRRYSLEYQKTYYKNNQHLDLIIKNVIKAEEAKLNTNHTFTRDEYIDPIIFSFENLLDRRYQTFLNINKSNFSENKLTLYRLTLRLFQEIIAGVTLLERRLYNDAFIVWRSLLETTTTFLILAKNPKLVGRFDERRKLALMRIGIVNSSTQTLKDKSKETATHLGVKGMPWFVQERFGWAGTLLKNKEYSVKSLLEIVNISDLHPHYAFASLFVHEYLLDKEDLKLGIDFNKYLLTLYFKIYELIRIKISDLFTSDLDDAKKLEEGIRSEVKNFSAQFNDFTLRIQNS